jgi:hypothetical protein
MKVRVEDDRLLTLMGGVLPQACMMPPRKMGMYLMMTISLC